MLDCTTVSVYSDISKRLVGIVTTVLNLDTTEEEDEEEEEEEEE